jgi:hypothetical protein
MSPSRSFASIRFTICAATLGFAVAGGAHIALAQAPSKPAPKSSASPSAASTAAPPPELIEGSEELQKLYLEGDAAMKRGDYATADTLFTRAWGVSKSFDVAGALGSTKLELGKYREAAQYLSFALRNALPSTKASARDRIKRDLDSARQKLAAVKLSASVVEAKFVIDGGLLDPIFLGPEIFVDPGRHTFEAIAEGYVTAKSSIEVKAGEIYVVSLTLERTPPPGVPTATATATATTPPGPPIPAMVMGGAGGAALIAGAVLVGLAESNKKDAYDFSLNTLTAEGNPTCPKKGPGPTEDCDKIRGAAANADLFGNVSIGLFIGGGALILGAGAYALIFGPEPAKDIAKPPPSTGRVVPVVGPNGGGLVWQGSF